MFRGTFDDKTVRPVGDERAAFAVGYPVRHVGIEYQWIKNDERMDIRPCVKNKIRHTAAGEIGYEVYGKQSLGEHAIVERREHGAAARKACAFGYRERIRGIIRYTVHLIEVGYDERGGVDCPVGKRCPGIEAVIGEMPHR